MSQMPVTNTVNQSYGLQRQRQTVTPTIINTRVISRLKIRQSTWTAAPSTAIGERRRFAEQHRIRRPPINRTKRGTDQLG